MGVKICRSCRKDCGAGSGAQANVNGQYIVPIQHHQTVVLQLVSKS